MNNNFNNNNATLLNSGDGMKQSSLHGSTCKSLNDLKTCGDESNGSSSGSSSSSSSGGDAAASDIPHGAEEADEVDRSNGGNEVYTSLVKMNEALMKRLTGLEQIILDLNKQHPMYSNDMKHFNEKAKLHERIRGVVKSLPVFGNDDQLDINRWILEVEHVLEGFPELMKRQEFIREMVGAFSGPSKQFLKSYLIKNKIPIDWFTFKELLLEHFKPQINMYNNIDKLLDLRCGRKGVFDFVVRMNAIVNAIPNIDEVYKYLFFRALPEEYKHQIMLHECKSLVELQQKAQQIYVDQGPLDKSGAKKKKKGCCVMSREKNRDL